MTKDRVIAQQAFEIHELRTRMEEIRSVVNLVYAAGVDSKINHVAIDVLNILDTSTSYYDED